MNTDDRKLIERALRTAAVHGFDPYNSHDTQSHEWQRKWERREAYRADKQAKFEVPSLGDQLLARLNAMMD